MIHQLTEGLNLKHNFALDYLVFSDLLHLCYIDVKFKSVNFEFEDFKLFPAFAFEIYH